MEQSEPQSSGVQELIARIRDDGVEAGQAKADDPCSHLIEAGGFHVEANNLRVFELFYKRLQLFIGTHNHCLCRRLLAYLGARRCVWRAFQELAG